MDQDSHNEGSQSVTLTIRTLMAGISSYKSFVFFYNFNVYYFLFLSDIQAPAYDDTLDKDNLAMHVVLISLGPRKGEER